MMRIEGNYTEIMRELDRLADDTPNWRTVRPLEEALETTFQQTQADTHVVTGSLRGSGNTSSNIEDARDRWVGEITYGGDSPGFPNNPVTYANYERDRGGDHDFLRNVHLTNDLFENAVGRVLRGDED